MAYTKKEHIKKRFYQAGVIAGLIAIPLTGGWSLCASLMFGVAGRKYNTFLQSEEERLDEKIYYKKKQVKNEYEKMKNKEIEISKRFKSIEDKVKGGRIEIKNE